MNSTRLGIFLPHGALDVSKMKYSLNFIKIFDKEKYINKVFIFVNKQDIKLIEKYVKYLQIKLLDSNKIFKIIRYLFTKKLLKLNYLTDFDIVIKKYNLTFGIFVTPSWYNIKCPIPYAASIHSLGHRLNPELSETSQSGNWKAREDVYSAVCKNAKLIFIDSERGKEYLKFFYNPNAEIVVLPHPVPDILKMDVNCERQKEILNKFKISKEFLFYPAQFWPHKNHVRVLEAVRYLKNKGIAIQLVFTGADKAIRDKYSIEYILQNIAKNSNMEDDLIITGYLENEEIKTFYINALAMIMPQLIPEPCIPYSEAMALGCPVIASDMPGIKEQVNNSGVLVDPYSIESIANGIESLFDKNKREKIIDLGYTNYKSIENLISLSSPLIEDAVMK